jgi:hypothetical protein
LAPRDDDLAAAEAARLERAAHLGAALAVQEEVVVLMQAVG